MRRAYPTFGLGTDSQKIYSNTSMNATYNPLKDFKALADEPLEGELANIDLTRDQIQDLRAQLSKFFIIGYDIGYDIYNREVILLTVLKSLGW